MKRSEFILHPSSFIPDLSASKTPRNQRPTINKPRVQLHEIGSCCKLHADIVAREDAADTNQRISRADMLAHARENARRLFHQRRARQSAIRMRRSVRADHAARTLRAKIAD